MNRPRTLWIVCGSLAALVLVAVLGGILVLRSAWFFEKVRARIVDTVETATGGRAEIGNFRFDWRRLRAEVDQFTLHGNEPAGRPPLLQAQSVVMGLKIVSALRRDVDIQSLEIRDPHIYLIVYPDGRTNVPEPKIRSKNAHTPLEALINLAVGRFEVQNGIFEVEARGRTPFTASGRNLAAKFLYEPAAPRYRGDIAMDSIDVRWPGIEALPLSVRMQLTLERNRIGVSSARLATGSSHVEFSGAVENLVSPRAGFQYTAAASLPELARIARLRNFERGTMELAGDLTWAGWSSYTISGKLRSSGIGFHQDDVRFRNFRADGELAADGRRIDLKGLRIAGETAYAGNWFPIQGDVANASLRGQDVELRGASLAVLGGSFEGNGSLQSFRRFRVDGTIKGFQARRVVAVYNSRQMLPWDSLIAGPVLLEGSLGQSRDLRASANVTLAPVAGERPVWGELNAHFDGSAGTLDLGTSIVNLPSSKAVVSGAIGQQIRVHLETRDLNDFLPVLGENPASLPVKLDNGSVIFDGTVTGKLRAPRIAGRLNVSRVLYQRKLFDSLQARVEASPDMVRVEDASLTLGRLRGEFQATVGLRDWKPEETSSIDATGALHNAALRDLAALADRNDLPASGIVNLTGQLSGVIHNPQAAGDLEVTKGSFQSEPFDRLTAHVSYRSNSLQVSSGQLTAGVKHLRFNGTFEHAANDFRAGRLQFDAESDAMPLDQIRTLRNSPTDVAGIIQFAARGAIDVSPAGYRLLDLNADATGRGIRLAGQPVGDTHLSARTNGPLLQVSLDSDVADSMLKGQGQWRLEGDYPGTAQFTFSRLDLTQLRAWMAPAKAAVFAKLRGFAEGEVRVEGPLRKPQSLKAELRIPKFELGPAPGAGPAPVTSFTLRNSGPIVAEVANSAITIQSAHLVGRSTDITVAGKVMLQPKNSVDVHVAGKTELSLLHDFNNAITSSGPVNVDAGIRGTLDNPQVTGRLEVQNAALSYADIPNGLSNASGVIIFSGDRATIQNLSGETGGGKLQFSGFAAYGGGNPAFRVHADGRGVRVRYPEGVSTVANANLDLTGTLKRSILTGNITILRSAFNIQSDFSSLLAKSAEPVRTPAQTGFFDGLNFDVTIDTAADVQFESSLAQGIAADANLRLRGTPANPALLGRIHISQGQILFFGTKYTIEQGSISFYNAVRIEPILDIDLETRARGIDITLSVTGPFNRLNVTPRSDPPLQFNEIVSLLATGVSPATDPNLAAVQSVTPQPFQQSASALLGQVISSPVSGRLQRFFGISKVRIDPSMPGITNNPLARLTLEQQVTPDITFTYITNVSNANPQVVSVEWAVNKKFSVLAQREENGLFGLDFFYKKQFK